MPTDREYKTDEEEGCCNGMHIVSIIYTINVYQNSNGQKQPMK